MVKSKSNNVTAAMYDTLVRPVITEKSMISSEAGKVVFMVPLSATKDDVKAAVEAMTYEPDDSQFQGEVGQRIEVELTVEKAIRLDGYYGPSTMHIFRDANGNAYVWTTASKSWEEGSTRLVRGTIKEHKAYRNVNQTVLTRCAEVKRKE